ncbi:hypothetical protein LguiA_012211 [Lonicera macranthoides]
MVLGESPHHPQSTESPTQSQIPPQIPIEIVTDEEMALIEAAFAATRSSSSSSVATSISNSSSSSSLFSSTQFNTRSIRSITILSKRRLSEDIEDFGGITVSSTHKKKMKKKNRMSFLHRFRRKRGLFVTDITSTEWCEKQTEFILLFGKPEATKAMKAGSAQHAVLEEEVVKRVKLRMESAEDAWAVKLLNFIVGANQLLFDGLTRELPLIGFSEGVWMGGVIDEIRMSGTETSQNPTLVETKTRALDTLPAEPQRRNARLQLMCYKYLWDSLVADKFPSRNFFNFFSLNPHYILSEDIRANTAKSGFPAETLDDLVRCYQNACSMLAPAHDQLLLRYEFQKDQSLIGEDEFEYDSSWVTGQITNCLEFWHGEREASYAPEEERWKCNHCKYASVCPINANTEAKES